MIKFGTDGWRAKIADEFTFENVKKVTLAFIKYLKDNKLDKLGVAVGFDNRFQSENFAKTAASICAGSGIKTYLTKESVPSPVLSFVVKSKKLGAGIMITASHNPPDWNGFKIKEAFGGSARPEVTKAVEEKLGQMTNVKCQMSNEGKIIYIDPKPNYFKHIEKLVDLKLIAKSGVKVVVDPMYGSGAGYIKEILAKHGMEVEEIHGNRDPLFGGINPEPLPVNLEDTISFMKTYDRVFSTCIVLDGDGDRLAAVDPSGTYLSSHNMFSLLLKHLVENRKMKGKVVKTFNISRLIEKQAKKYKLNLKEVPIGFKYIADIMLNEKIIIGGEESGGMGIPMHLPERDGTLCGLLLLELMAKTGYNLKQILDQIMDKLGYYYYDRIDLQLKNRDKTVKKLDEIKNNPPKTFAKQEVVKVETLDGLKLNFQDESWLLFRLSGTEPLLRIYAEGRTTEGTQILLGEGEKLFRL
ncbi:MAG: phosphoglucomutase/phosphomannomutase family protein [Candidatus Saganbacteria bacterium]|nr:phosphoglucomutase/phosphomannomutase family protein [Candidatus Saganbacteria bacterium]